MHFLTSEFGPGSPCESNVNASPLKVNTYSPNCDEYSPGCVAPKEASIWESVGETFFRDIFSVISKLGRKYKAIKNLLWKILAYFFSPTYSRIGQFVVSKFWPFWQKRPVSLFYSCRCSQKYTRNIFGQILTKTINWPTRLYNSFINYHETSQVKIHLRAWRRVEINFAIAQRAQFHVIDFNFFQPLCRSAKDKTHTIIRQCDMIVLFRIALDVAKIDMFDPFTGSLKCFHLDLIKNSQDCGSVTRNYKWKS